MCTDDLDQPVVKQKIDLAEPNLPLRVRRYFTIACKIYLLEIF